jgi:hypothetical protein
MFGAHARQQTRSVRHQRVEVGEIAADDAPPRRPLPAPIERNDGPAAIVPMPHRLQIFLDEIAAAAGEQERAPHRPALRLRPVHAADSPSVRRLPVPETRARRMCPPVQPTDFHGRWLRFGK